MSAQQENRRRLEDMSQQELIQHIHHMQTEIRENFVPRFYHEQIANEEYDVPREQHAIFHVLNEDSRAMLAARAKLGGDIERVQALKGELTEAKRRWAEEHMVSTDEPVQPKELTLADDSIEESTSRVIEKMATRATIHGLRKRIEILQMLLGDHFSYHARYHRSQDAGQTRSRLCRFVMLFAQIMEVLETHNDGIDRLEGETGVAVRKIREWMKQELEFNWTKSAVDQIKKARTHGFPPRPQTSNPTLNPEEDHATAGPSTEPAGQTQDPRIQGGGYRASLTWRPGPLGDSSRPPPPKRQRVDYTQQPDEYTPEQIPKGKMPMTYADQAIENTAWNPMPTPNVINGQNSGFGLAPATMQQHQYPGHPPPQFQNQHFPHFPTYPSVDPSVDNPLSIATHFPIPPLTIPTSTPSASDPSSSSSSQLQGQFPPAAEPLNPADDNFDILNDDDALYAVDDGVQFSADDNFDFDDTIQVAADDIAQIAADDGVQFAPPQNDSQETAQDHVQSPEVCNSQDTLQDVQATDENDQDTIDQDQGLLDVTDLEFEAFFGSNNEDDRTHSPGCDI